MKPVAGRPGWTWEQAFLATAALATVAGYAVAAAAYFVAPSRWTLPLEVVLYRLPGIQHARLGGGLGLLALWITGCALLCRRAWKGGTVPWAGTALAALAPLLALGLNAAFLEAMRRFPPFCLRW
jgi:hypothetical protein